MTTYSVDRYGIAHEQWGFGNLCLKNIRTVFTLEENELGGLTVCEDCKKVRLEWSNQSKLSSSILILDEFQNYIDNRRKYKLRFPIPTKIKDGQSFTITFRSYRV